ncbi:MAG: hypothetical protein Q9163_003634 [Psora crenata]
MTTKDVILRQHLLDGSQKNHLVRLSLDGTVISYGIYMEGVGQDQDDTENGHICVEAFATAVQVQSFASGFDGCSANGRMQLKPSLPPHHRVLLQLHPGESIYVGSLHLSIVPQEHVQFPVLPSEYTGSHYQSYVEQVSQAHSSSVMKPDSSVPDTPLRTRHYIAITSDQVKAPNFLNPEFLGISRNLDNHSNTPTSINYTVMRDEHKGDRLDNSALAQGRTPESRRNLDHGARPPWKLISGSDEARSEANADLTSHEKRTYGSGDEEAEAAISRPELVRECQVFEANRTQTARSANEPTSLEEDDQESILSTIRTNMPEESRAKGAALDGDKPSEERILRRPIEGTPQASITTTTDEQCATPDEPHSPVRSTRFANREDASNLSNVETGIKVVFASSSAVGGSKQFSKFLNRQGVRIVDCIKNCNVLCVSKGNLKKTSKLIMAVLLGKQIATDDWVTDSAKAGRLLDVQRYLVRDHKKEAEWGIRLNDAIDRGTQGVRPFQGWTITFTQKAKKDAGKDGFHELKELAIMAGAKQVSSVQLTKPMADVPLTLIIASVDDPFLAEVKTGLKCFTRDIIGISILRGVLDTSSDEFLAQPAEEVKSSKKRKR